MSKLIGLTRSALGLLLLPVAATPLARAQAPTTPPPISNTMPTANFGFNLPSHLGTLRYSLTASELLQLGYAKGGVSTSTAGSGNLAYLSKSENDPFSVVYSGGFIHTNVPGNSTNETFQDISFSQVYRTRSWVYVVSDGFSFLPQSPTTGLSGIAGVGDVGVPPVQTGIGPGQTILTDYGRRISNGLRGSATWQITAATALEGSAAWQVLRFVGASNPGLDTSDLDFTFGPTHRINALSSIAAHASYSRQSYPGFAGALIETEGVNFDYNRTWSRKISTSVSIGPERSHGEGFGVFPSRTDIGVGASLTYAGRNTGTYLSYSRGVSGGSGVIPGAFTDTVSIGANRPMGRSWQAGIDGSYSRSVALFEVNNRQTRIQSIFGAVQLSRRLTEDLSCYGGYTAIEQSIATPTLTENAFSGFRNIVSFGITFSPPPLHRAQ
jgi:hypothetical protein